MPRLCPCSELLKFRVWLRTWYPSPGLTTGAGRGQETGGATGGNRSRPRQWAGLWCPGNRASALPVLCPQYRESHSWWLVLPHPPLPRQQGHGRKHCAKHHKASHIIGWGKSPLTHFCYLIGGGTKEGKYMEREVRMAAREGRALLRNVLAGVFMGPSDHRSCKVDGSTGPTLRSQEGAWSLTVAERKTEPPGWPLSGHLPFPKDSILNGRRNCKLCLWFWSFRGWLGFPLGFPEGNGFETWVCCSPRSSASE